MRLRRFRYALAVVVAAGAVVPASPAVAAPTCFGKRATIVGTSRGAPADLKGTDTDDVIVGGGGSDHIEGRGGDDLICGGGGDDYILAGAGNDRVTGQDSLDTVIGGAGRDRLWGGTGGGDSLSGGPGSDRLVGGPGHEDRLLGGSGDDSMDGGAGYDHAEFWDSPNGIEADLRADTASGFGTDTIVSIEGLVGSNLDDVLIGDDLSNDIQPGGGNDSVRALGSSGDGGADILRGSEGNNVLDGGDGPDIASYNVTPWPVTADLVSATTTSDFGSDTLVGIEHLTGSKENDTLIGDDGDNVIIGNGGDDVMDGGGGVDEAAFLDSRMPVIVDLGAGTAEADWWGSDTFVNFENVAGSVWRDVLVGDDGPNLIWGGDRADSIRGLGGDDVLLGAIGADEVDGGSDIDTCDGETEIDCELDPTGRPRDSGSRRL